MKLIGLPRSNSEGTLEECLFRLQQAHKFSEELLKKLLSDPVTTLLKQKQVCLIHTYLLIE
jgi:hypothetical protein